MTSLDRWVLRARRCYHALRQALGKATDDIVLDAARGEPDRVRDRPPGRVSVRDHGEAAQTEQVGAAVGVRVEARAQAARRGAGEEGTEPARQRRCDLAAEGVE